MTVLIRWMLMLRVRPQLCLKQSGLDSKNARTAMARADEKCSGEALLSPKAGLLATPLLHLGVIPREQDLGDLPAAVAGRPGVVRVFGRPLQRLAVGLLHGALGIAEGARQLAQHCVRDHHRGQLAAGEDVAADRDRLVGEVLGDALIEALVAPTEQRDMWLGGELNR